MSKSPISRRHFLRGLATTSAGTALLVAGCQPKTVVVEKEVEKEVTRVVKETVKETVVVEGTPKVVEKEVTKIVKETVIVEATPMPPPVPPPEPAKVVMMVDTGEFSDEELDGFLGQSNLVSEVERIGTDTTRLRAMWAGGNPPDIWRASGADVPQYVTLGWPLDLTEFFNSSEVLKPEDMAPAVGYFQYQGGWYGMHKDFSPDMSLQINVAAFEEASIPVPEEGKIYTYVDAAEWAHALTKREGDRTVRIGWADNGWWDGILQTVLMEEGQDLFVDDFSKANIKDNERVVEVLTFYANLAKDNVIWNPLNPSPSWPGDDLVTGRAGFIRYGYWMHGTVLGAEEDDLPNPREKFQMRPALSWGGKTAVNPPLGGAGWFLARTTQVAPSAWDLFEYYMGGPPAESRAGSGWGLPALKSLFPLVPHETPFDQQWYDSVMWELENTVQTSRQLNPFIATGNINSAWDVNLELYLNDEIALEEAIDNVDQEVNGALRERIDAVFGG
jgi:multiple sugar transport system substrate-binding protein